jgi:DNA polymerase III alpha subunit
MQKKCPKTAALSRVDLDPADAKILIKAGAMDTISGGATRPEMIWRALAWHESRASRRAIARTLFQDMPAVVPPRVPQYSARTVLEHELETLDFLISRHPLTLYEQPLSKLRCVKGKDLPRYGGRQVTTVGWWVTGKLSATKDDEPMEFISFEDTTALYETIFFPAGLRALLPHAEPLPPLRADRRRRRRFRRRNADRRFRPPPLSLRGNIASFLPNRTQAHECLKAQIIIQASSHGKSKST